MNSVGALVSASLLALVLALSAMPLANAANLNDILRDKPGSSDRGAPLQQQEPATAPPTLTTTPSKVAPDVGQPPVRTKNLAPGISVIRNAPVGIYRVDAIRFSPEIARDLVNAASEGKAILSLVALGIFDPFAARLLGTRTAFSMTPQEARDRFAKSAAAEQLGIDPIIFDGLTAWFQGQKFLNALRATKGDLYIALGRHPGEATFYNGWVYVVSDLGELAGNPFRSAWNALHFKSLDEGALHPCGCTLALREDRGPRPNCWQKRTFWSGSGDAYANCPKQCNPGFSGALLKSNMQCPTAFDAQRTAAAMSPWLAQNLGAARRLIAVVDSSGSMKETDPQALRIAALRLMIDSLESETELAIVDFDSRVRILQALQPLGPIGGPVRASLQAKLLSVDDDGGTSIRDALATAANLVGDDVAGASLIMLSDGKDEHWSGDASMLPGGLVVHTIALSDEADRASMRKLSHSTNGRAEVARSAWDLHRVIANLVGVAGGRELMLAASGTLQQGEQQVHHVYVEPGARNLQVQVTWPGSDIDLKLTDPGGKVFSAAADTAGSRAGSRLEGPTYDMVTLVDPAPGRWRIEVIGVDLAAAGEPYELRADLTQSNVRTNLRLADKTPAAGGDLGLDLSQSGRIGWKTAMVVTWGPDGTSRKREVDLRAAPGGGVLQTIVPATPGVYRVQANLIGETADGHQVSRAFDRTIEVLRFSKPKTQPPTKPAVDRPPRITSLNDIIRSLAPIDPKDQSVAGVPPSIDLHVTFELNSARLTPLARRQLNELAGALRDRRLRQSNIRIIGHTDATGAAGHNLVLSQRRAAAVRDFLVATHGITPSRLQAVGRGEEELKDLLDPASAENRRVQVISLGQQN